jgi:hypothetical protein
LEISFGTAAAEEQTTATTTHSFTLAEPQYTTVLLAEESLHLNDDSGAEYWKMQSKSQGRHAFDISIDWPAHVTYTYQRYLSSTCTIGRLA